MTGELSVEMNEIVGKEYSGVLQKPFMLEELVEAMQQALKTGDSDNPLS